MVCPGDQLSLGVLTDIAPFSSCNSLARKVIISILQRKKIDKDSLWTLPKVKLLVSGITGSEPSSDPKTLRKEQHLRMQS